MGPFKLTTRPQQMPARCIVSGFTDGPFLDTGVESPYVEPWVYIQVDVLKDMARTIGMVPAEELEQERALREDAELRVHMLQRENEDLNALHDSYDGLTRAGYVVRKAPGRKPNKKAAA